MASLSQLIHAGLQAFILVTLLRFQVKLTIASQFFELTARRTLRYYGPAVRRCHGVTVLRYYAATVLRHYAATVLRYYGITVPRCDGIEVLRCTGDTVLRSTVLKEYCWMNTAQ